MIFYIVTILAAATGIAVFNFFVTMPVYGFSPGYNILAVAVSTVSVIALDGLIASVFHAVQNKFDPFSKFFTVSKRQKKFLERLGVRKYKRLLPDLGVLVKFPKGKIVDPKSKEYVHRYILESCSGELNHIFSMFLGFLIIFLFPLKYFLCFGIPVATVNLILNSLPAMALRYNRYTLTHLYNKLNRAGNAGASD